MTSSNLMFIEITWKIICITLDQGDFDRRFRESHARELETWKLEANYRCPAWQGDGPSKEGQFRDCFDFSV